MKTPYHTSILTGEGWVLELLTGHPRRIHTELGVSHAVFDKLISTLHSMGLHSSHRIHLKNNIQDAIGTLDGTHISVSPSTIICMAFQNCKGFILQNCLFACNFNMLFIYSLCKWEGSAMDALVYQDAQMHDLTIPEGKYYLADAGYL
jgi:hypothetical protein